MSQFHFITRWVFEAPREKVWELLNKPERFPEWWPGFERAWIVSGDGAVGSTAQYRVRGNFGLVFNFTMTLEEKQEPERMLLKASGDFIGAGEWLLKNYGNKTVVTYIWNVQVTRFWPRLLSQMPGSRRLLERSHDKVMDAGEVNLSRLLQAP